jgi:hypothetical protein
MCIACLLKAESLAFAQNVRGFHLATADYMFAEASLSKAWFTGYVCFEVKS